MIYSSYDSKGVPLEQKLEKLFNGKRFGKFIELGANDGITQSNTKHLEEKFQWHGILIEPSIPAFNKLKQTRHNNILINACVVSNDYKENTIKGDFNSGSLMSSVNGSRLNSDNLVEVPCFTLEYIIEKCNLMDNHFNLISIDTEGYELNVLKGINLKKFMPDYLLIEIYKKDYDEIVKYLDDNNYKLIENFTNYNIIDNPHWDGTHNDYLFGKK